MVLTALLANVLLSISFGPISDSGLTMIKYSILQLKKLREAKELA